MKSQKETFNIANAFISAIENPVIVLDTSLRVLSWNSSFEQEFQFEERDRENKSFFKVNDQQWDLPILREKLSKVINKNKNKAELEIKHTFKNLGEKKLFIDIKKIQLLNNTPKLVLLTIEEISDLNQTRRMLSKSKKEIEIRDKISEAFSTTSNDKVYDKVLQIILDILDSDIGYFGYINEEGALVCPTMTREVWDKCQVPDKNIIFPKEQWGGLWGKSLEEKENIIKNEDLNTPIGHIPLENALCVPIIYKNELIGQIVVGNKDSDYSQGDMQMLEGLAKQISPILNARLERDRKEEERKQIEQELRATKQEEVLDFIDKQILNQLYTDGKMSLNRIKQYVVKKNGEHMSHTGINNRIEKLAESDILKIQGNINLKQLNYQAAVVLIELKQYDLLEEYIIHASTCPRIFLLATTTGKYHLLFGMVGKNIEEINCCLNNCDLVGKEAIKNSEIIFAPNLKIPNYIPINLFSNIDKEIQIKDECVECESYKVGICRGCGV